MAISIVHPLRKFDTPLSPNVDVDRFVVDLDRTLLYLDLALFQALTPPGQCCPLVALNLPNARKSEREGEESRERRVLLGVPK